MSKRTMQWFLDLPLRKKLTFVIMLTTLSALFVAGIASVGVEVLMFRPRAINDVQAKAEEIGRFSAAALIFHDPVDARESLASLRTRPDVTAGCIYTRFGKPFAVYRADPDADVRIPISLDETGHRFDGGDLLVFHPIIHEGRRLGSVFLRSNLSHFYQRLAMAIGILILTLVCGLIIALIVSGIAQRAITEPILHLAGVSDRVAKRRDFSIRAERKGRDEIGSLMIDFNLMLNVIQSRDRELRQARSDLEKRVQERTVELTRAVDELEQRNAEMERFTYTVSHDLKSPLITIQGFLGLLERDVSRGDQERMKTDADHIRNAVQKMKVLLEELLEMSRAGRVIMDSQEIELTDLATEAVELVAGRIAQGEVEVTVQPDMPVVSGDPARLREVMQNLVDNAVKYIGAGPERRIEIEAERNGSETTICVRDSGIGIADRYQDRIFGLFEQLNPASEGVGIGLPLVKRIIEVHSGRVWVESSGEGRGSAFYFTIPDNIEQSSQAG